MGARGSQGEPEGARGSERPPTHTHTHTHARAHTPRLSPASPQSGRKETRQPWAEAPGKIARMTLTIKLDRNWSSFQLANSAPPLSVTDSAIAPSARMPRPCPPLPQARPIGVGAPASHALRAGVLEMAAHRHRCTRWPEARAPRLPASISPFQYHKGQARGEQGGRGEQKWAGGRDVTRRRVRCSRAVCHAQATRGGRLSKLKRTPPRQK